VEALEVFGEVWEIFGLLSLQKMEKLGNSVGVLR
jgi:hypothetical protein